MFETHFVKDAGMGVQAAAKANLEKLVEEGKKRATPTLAQILTVKPTDIIAPSDVLDFSVHDDGVRMRGEHMADLPLHANAVGQLAGRFGIPTGYARTLSSGLGWQQDLLQHVLQKSAKEDKKSLLVRSQDGMHKAVLSDKYRRLDSEPLIAAFMRACDAVGAVPVDGIATDLRSSLRAILPKVFEPMPGEAMVLGVEWKNSDFGKGAYGLSFFAMRLVCLNGMVAASQLRQQHLGQKLDQTIDWSLGTHEADSKLVASQTEDLVRGLLSESSIADQMSHLARQGEQEVNINTIIRRFQNHMSKDERTAVKNAFESKEQVLLPPGKNAWRASNALSWIANEALDNERRLALQELAGRVLD